MISRNDPCWCGSGIKWKKCHYPKTAPEQPLATEKLADLYRSRHGIILKTPEQIEGIRRACKLSSEILMKAAKMAKVGVTTFELDEYAARLHKEAGAIPAPLGYGNPPFPKSICTSVNEVICHGIPEKVALKDGDIVNIDVTCILDGYYGDCSLMVEIGTPNPEKQRVVNVAYECLMRSIQILKPGIPISKIGDIITNYAETHGCSVVNQFVGHGVGLKFHEPPQIPHSKNNLDIILQPGMTFTIEPMINAGVREAIIDSNDQWTARTKDGKPSAQWEHTLLITENSHEILTPWKRLGFT